MKIRVLFFFWLIWGAFAYSQSNFKLSSDSIKYHVISISPSLGSTKSFDQQLSQLHFKGLNFGLNLGLEFIQSPHNYQFKLFGTYHQLSSETKMAEYPCYLYEFGFSGSYLHRINSVKKIPIYLGAAIQHQAIFTNNPNLMNASLTLWSKTNLGIGFKILKTWLLKERIYKIGFIKLKQRSRYLMANFRLDIPVFSYNDRSPFTTIDNFTDGQSEWELEKEVYLNFFKSVQLSTQTEFYYFLQNGNAFRIAYQWNAFKFDNSYYIYQSAHHQLVLSLIIKLNKNE